MSEADALARLTREGWEVVYRDAEGIQLRKRKQWNRVGLGLGMLFLVGGPVLAGPLLGAAVLGPYLMLMGLAGIGWEVVLYLMRRDTLEYLRAADVGAPPIAPAPIATPWTDMANGRPAPRR